MRRRPLLARSLHRPRGAPSAPGAAVAAAMVLVAASLLAAQAPAVPTPESPVRAIAVEPAVLRVDPDPSSAVVGQVLPGQNVALLNLAHGFAQVFVMRSGWMLDKGLVRLTQPGGGEILFGAASQFEQRAEDASGQRVAAQNAARLYYSVYDNFPFSPLAGEALFRAAEIRWQLGLNDMPVVADPSQRRFPDDSLLKRVRSKYPGTPWAARADFLLLQEKLTCGIWDSKPSCIGKEIDHYRDYLKKYPRGPRSAEAAYDIVYRDGAAWSLYRAGDHADAGKAAHYRAAAIADAAAVQRDFPGTDWAAQAALIAFKIQQDIAVYPG